MQEIFPETQQMLRRIYRQSRHHQVRQRAHCILLRAEGYSVPQLMNIFLVSRKTIYNWFSAWDAESIVGLYNHPGRGRKQTFSDTQKDQIRIWAQEHPRQLKQIVQKVQAAWGKTVSTETIKRVLKSLQMSWHRFRRVVGGEPDPQEYAQKQSQLKALERLEQAGEIELYYLDETGFCLIPCIPYGWQPIGETLEIPSQQSQRLNVLGFMSRSNQLHSYVSEQTITSEVVIACVDAFFPSPSKRTVIVVDQAPIHTSNAIYDSLEQWKERQIEIFELPTYSPELNLIEILWRFMKYEWVESSAYQNWQSLVNYAEKVLREFGRHYVINFA
jgi:transposase